MSDNRKDIWVLFPFFVVGALFFWFGFHMEQLESERITSFVPVTVTIRHLEVGDDSDTEGGTSYFPVVTYHYQVKGQDYTGHRFAPTRLKSSLREVAEEQVHRFHVGQALQGYYNPSNPAESYLVKERNSWFFQIFLAIGSLVMLITGYLMWNVLLNRT